jgi:hypothetical protein
MEDEKCTNGKDIQTRVGDSRATWAPKLVGVSQACATKPVQQHSALHDEPHIWGHAMP